jgi:hypothetical protein
LDAVERVKITPDQFLVEYRSSELKSNLRNLFQGQTGENELVLTAVAAQLNFLLREPHENPGGDRMFVELVQWSFGLAFQRSINGDPVSENRAAILALAKVLGHRKFEILVGLNEFGEQSSQRLPSTSRATAYERRDWVQHFAVSAGLAALSNRTVSDAAGILKEEIDAGRGGSGFSFGDLLADRSGTEFALLAIRDPETARAIQQRIAAGLELEDLMADGHDLPEGIPAADLETKYGGVDGAKYREIVQTIEQRVSQTRDRLLSGTR